MLLIEFNPSDFLDKDHFSKFEYSSAFLSDKSLSLTNLSAFKLSVKSFKDYFQEFEHFKLLNETDP